MSSCGVRYHAPPRPRAVVVLQIALMFDYLLSLLLVAATGGNENGS
jgi:hypothetical protein